MAHTILWVHYSYQTEHRGRWPTLSVKIAYTFTTHPQISEWKSNNYKTATKYEWIKLGQLPILNKTKSNPIYSNRKTNQEKSTLRKEY